MVAIPTPTQWTTAPSGQRIGTVPGIVKERFW
jgi:hypothetical protein